MKRSLKLLIFLLAILIITSGCGKSNNGANKLDAVLEFKFNELTFTSSDIVSISSNESYAKSFECFYQESSKMYICPYKIVLGLSDTIAKKLAKESSNMQANGDYLQFPIDVSLGNQKIDEIRLPLNQKGVLINSLEITGVGLGSSSNEAFDNAKNQFDIIVNQINNK